MASGLDVLFGAGVIGVIVTALLFAFLPLLFLVALWRMGTALHGIKEALLQAHREGEAPSAPSRLEGSPEFARVMRSIEDLPRDYVEPEPEQANLTLQPLGPASAAFLGLLATGMATFLAVIVADGAMTGVDSLPGVILIALVASGGLGWTFLTVLQRAQLARVRPVDVA